MVVLQVRIWDINTGKATYFFTEAHGDSKINAAALDNLGRRLVTGAQDGTVKVLHCAALLHCAAALYCTVLHCNVL